MKSTKMKIFKLTIFTLILTSGCFSPVGNEVISTETECVVISTDNFDSTETELVTESEIVTETEISNEYDIKLMAVGDNLMHMGVINSGKQEDGSYDYSFLFDGISDFLEAADIKMINQETILGGNERGLSGYPRFNSPTEMGDTLAAVGFNVVLHASNHAGDQDTSGLISCAAFWDKYPDILTVGIHTDTNQAGEKKIQNT